MSLMLINIATNTCESKYYKFVILSKIFEDCFLTKTRIKILCKTNSKSLSFVYLRSIDRRDNNSIFNSSINNISLIDT